MRIVEIAALPNGAHRNQNNAAVLPNGWAVIPDDMSLENFPFGEVTAEEVTYYREVQTEREVTKTREVITTQEVITTNEDGEEVTTEEEVTTTEEYADTETVTEQKPYTVLTVTGWVAGTIPEVEEVEAEPTEEDDTAAMLVDHEYRIVMLELGLAE